MPVAEDGQTERDHAAEWNEEFLTHLRDHPGVRDISLFVQTRTGKADAVRLGFDRAKHKVLLILDADLSVDPEEMRTFYDALAEGLQQPLRMALPRRT